MQPLPQFLSPGSCWTLLPRRPTTEFGVRHLLPRHTQHLQPELMHRSPIRIHHLILTLSSRPSRRAIPSVSSLDAFVENYTAQCDIPPTRIVRRAMYIRLRAGTFSSS